jgi:chromosome segregation ATPase
VLQGVVVAGRLVGVEAEIAKVNLQIDAVGAEIAKVGNKLEAIDGQLKQLMSGQVPENMKDMVAFQVRRQHSKDPEEAFNAAVDVLIADLNKDKENLNKDKDRLAQEKQDLRKEKERLSAEKAVLLSKLPGGGSSVAGNSSPHGRCP